MNKINDLVTVHRPGFALQKMSTKIVAINEKGVWHKPAASKAVAILVNKSSSSGIGWDYYPSLKSTMNTSTLLQYNVYWVWKTQINEYKEK